MIVPAKYQHFFTKVAYGVISTLNCLPGGLDLARKVGQLTATQQHLVNMFDLVLQCFDVHHLGSVSSK